MEYRNSKLYESAQIDLINKQNRLIEQQTLITVEQNKSRIVSDIVKRRFNWTKLAGTVHKLFWDVHIDLYKTNEAEKIAHYESLLKLLKGDEANPVLVENHGCFKTWEHLISIVELCLNLFNPKVNVHIPISGKNGFEVVTPDNPKYKAARDDILTK